MEIRVLFFAQGRELAGISETTIHMGPLSDSSQLEASILSTYPKLADIWSTCILARNQEYLVKGEKVALEDGDEVAVVPPISGG